MPRKAKKIKEAPLVDLNQITLKDKNFYVIDGVAYPRCTWILSYYPKGEGLNRWMGGQASYEAAQEAMHKAGDRGTKVHQAIQDLIAGQSLMYQDFPEDQWAMISSFVQWCKDFNPKFLANEQLVYSKEYSYAGTFDSLVEIGNQKYIVDFKTSGALYPSYNCQVAAYIQAYLEMNKDFKETLVPALLRLGTKHRKGYEFVTKPTWEDDFQTFIAVKHIFEAENPDLKPKIKTINKTLAL